jgi:hypothetical protein
MKTALASACVVVAFVAMAGCGAIKAQPGGCATAAQCTDPTAPFCVDSECQSTCSVNGDCPDSSHGLCSMGACVQCETSSDCGDATAPICDTGTHECRGCTIDTECTGGVCVEAQGTCVADADVAFVANNGTSTTCTRAAPCGAIASAIANAPTRTVIHVLGGDLLDNAMMLTGTHIIDGENTIFGFSGSTAVTVTGPATITIEGFQFTEPPAASNMPAIMITGQAANATVYNVSVSGAGGHAITTQNEATLNLSHSHVGVAGVTGRSEIDCINATLNADQNVFLTSYITNGTGACTAKVTRNKFDSNNDGSVQISGGQVIMENNLIIHEDGFNDSILVENLAAGSTVRYNTVVNTTGAPSDGAAIDCDNSAEITSNVFAYNSMHSVVGQGCNIMYSIFDTVSITSAGTGNQVVDIDSIFVDRVNGDYHLAANSVAKMAAEPGQTMTKIDFDGNPRPNPVGTTSDSGAFEAP